MPDQLDAMLDSWTIDMRARDLSRDTQKLYLRAARALATAARATGATTWDTVDRTAVRTYIADLVERTSASNGSTHFRSLQQLFKWLLEEDEIETNPMAGMKGPKPDTHPVPVLGDDDLTRLLTSVAGRDWVDRRDNAVLRTLLDTGIRLAELAGLDVDDVDLVQREAVVTGKGRRTRTVRFGFKTAKAIDRYLRVRVTHPIAETSSALWLAPKRVQPMTSSGLAQIVERRGRAVGLHLHPHRFRHNFAHQWLDQGGAEGDLMEIAGWTSGQMLQRYGASARSARARKAYDRLQIGDRF